MKGIAELGCNAGPGRWKWAGLVLAGLTWVTGARAAPVVKLSPLQLLEPRPQKEPMNPKGVVASDGDGWLAVYDVGWAMTGQRIQADGAPLGDGFTVGPNNNSTARDPRVAFDGVDYVTAFQTHGNVRSIGIQRIGSSEPGPIIDLKLNAEWEAFDLAVDGSGVPRVLACDPAYVNSFCSTAALVGEESTVGPGFTVPFVVQRVTLAFSGGSSLAIVEAADGQVALLELSTTGELLDWRTLENADVTVEHPQPTIVSTLDGYAAAWRRTDGIRVAALSVEGDLVASQVVSDDSSFGRPLLVPTANDWLLLSSNESSGCSGCVNIYGQTLSPELDTAPSEAVLIAEEVDDSAVVAAGASKALVAFSDAVSLDAVLVEPSQPTAVPHREPIAFGTYSQQLPAIATAKDDGWLMIWNEHDELRSALIDLEGVPRAFALTPPPAVTSLVAIEEGNDGWLAVWGGKMQVSRVSSTGVAGEPYPLKDGSVARIARSSSGWLVVWSQFHDVRAEFFDFEGVHQGSRLIAKPNGLLSHVAPFDVAATADGFQIVWSGPYEGIWSLALDATGQPTSEPEQLRVRDADWLQLAVTPDASWLGYAEGSESFFDALPLPSAEQAHAIPSLLLQAEPMANAAVLAFSDDREGGQSGMLGIAPRGEGAQISDIAFPTDGRNYGFALSKAIDSRALLATRTMIRQYGVFSNRLHIGLVTVSETPDGEGGAGGSGGGHAGESVGGSGESVGGSNAPTTAGVGGLYDPQQSPTGGFASGGAAPAGAGEAATSSGNASSSAGEPTAEPDPRGDEGGVSKPHTSSGCGCDVGNKQAPSGSVFGGLALLATLALRRRAWLS